MTSIFDQIRDAAEAVSSGTRWVHLQHEELFLYPERLLLNVPVELEHTSEHHLLGKGDDTLAYFLILDTINFGSGYFPFLDKDRDASGYFTVAKRLKTYCETHGIPTAGSLARLSLTECASIFSQSLENRHAEELMWLFSTALNHLGRWIEETHRGDYLGVFRSATSASDVVDALTNMPFYRDVSTYGSLSIPFFKRAQILIQDVCIAEPHHPLLQFPDRDRLTVFADNVIPYVLHQDGILRYDPWLERRIEREELIASGSTEEIELRACSVHAAELLAEIISSEVRPVKAREIDFYLWHRGQALKKTSTAKRHRTRTTFY